MTQSPQVLEPAFLGQKQVWRNWLQRQSETCAEEKVGAPGGPDLRAARSHPWAEVPLHKKLGEGGPTLQSLRAHPPGCAETLRKFKGRAVR